jgi:hypothetical protein
MIPYTKVNHMITPIIPNHFDTIMTQYHLILFLLTKCILFKFKLSYLSKICGISIKGFVLTTMVLVYSTPWHISYPMYPNGILESHSQMSSLHTQPHIQLILWTYIELFNFQMS